MSAQREAYIREGECCILIELPPVQVNGISSEKCNCGRLGVYNFHNPCYSGCSVTVAICSIVCELVISKRAGIRNCTGNCVIHVRAIVVANCCTRLNVRESGFKHQGVGTVKSDKGLNDILNYDGPCCNSCIT